MNLKKLLCTALALTCMSGNIPAMIVNAEEIEEQEIILIDSEENEISLTCGETAEYQFAELDAAELTFAYPLEDEEFYSLDYDQETGIVSITALKEAEELKLIVSDSNDDKELIITISEEAPEATEEPQEEPEQVEVLPEVPAEEIPEEHLEETAENVTAEDPGDELVDPVPVDVVLYKIIANFADVNLQEAEKGTEIVFSVLNNEDMYFIGWEGTDELTVLEQTDTQLKIEMPEHDIEVTGLYYKWEKDTDNVRRLKNPDGTPVTNQFMTLKGKTFYFENGVTVSGLKKVNNKWYYLDPANNNEMTTNKFVTSGKAPRYFGADGIMYTRGPHEIAGKKYYFDPSNGLLTTGLVKLDNKWYYFDPDKKGAMTIGAFARGNNVLRYFDENGVMVSGKGLTKINGEWYYIIANGKISTNTFERMNGTRRYFGNDGKMAVGVTKCSDGNIYYFGANGTIQSGEGLKKIDGKWYYSTAGGVLKADAFIKANGVSRYFGPDGVMVTGFAKVRGKWYYFLSNGQMFKGWGTVNGKRRYFNDSGIMATGWLTIGSRKYYMDKSTGVLTTGWKTIDAARYHFNKNSGLMYSNGTYSIEGKTCEFNPFGQYIDYDRYRAISRPYWIKVNRAWNTVTIYGKDLNGNYKIPVKAFVCSVGMDGMNEETGKKMETPIGETSIYKQRRWAVLASGETWGQYVSFIYWGQYSIHSVQYMVDGDPASLAKYEYIKLGNSASNGCIRLVVRDVKWIYDNCPVETPVKIFDDWSTPGPLGKPSPPYLNLDDWRSCWDPTDPDGNNPWRWY